MRKLFGLAACVIVSTIIATKPAQAQAIGLKVGGSNASIDLKPESDADLESLIGFTGGAFIRFAFAGVVLQIEALALNKGSHFVFEDLDANATMKLEYIEVPVTVMVALGAGAYGLFGPSFGFERGCSVDATIGADNFEADCVGQFDDPSFERKKLDIGFALGAGYQWPFGPGMVLVEGRYTYGLTNLNNSSSADTEKLRNRSWIFLTGYSIPIGH